MEKQGMGRRRRLVRAGLLSLVPIILLILFPANMLFSQEAGELELIIETSPDNPTVGSAWSLFILIDHPTPQELIITPPAFPASIALELIRTETRFIQGRLWTSVEYSFTPLMAADVTLAPFGVSAPGRYAATGVTAVSFQPSADAPRYNPDFRWLSPLPSVPSGERGEISLELSGWDPQRPVPGGIFRGRAPRNAILNETAPQAAGEGVYLFTISIIPLDENDVALEPFSFQASGFSLSIPGITVPVLPPLPLPPPQAPAQITAEPPVSAPPREEIAVIPFPETREAVFFFLQSEYDRIIAAVRALWEEGRRAQALAEIRRNERDSLSGPFLVPLRGEMEQALGLGFTENERWRPRSGGPVSLPFFVWALLVIAAISAGAFLVFLRTRLGKPGQRNRVPASEPASPIVTSRRRGGFRNVIILVFFIGLALIVLEAGWGTVSMRRLTTIRKTAILERTPAHRVPDLNGAINAWFDEGQPVILGTYHLDWCYVESPDGRSGWVPRWAVITY